MNATLRFASGVNFKRIVSVDFDGVLAERPKGNQEIGADIPEGIKMVKGLVSRGYQVVVMTAKPPQIYPYLRQWLARRGIKGEVTGQKLPSVLYIDDNGFRWTGHPGDAEKVFAVLNKFPEGRH